MISRTNKRFYSKRHNTFQYFWWNVFSTTGCSAGQRTTARMNGTSKDGCMSMLASVIGGALLGVVATTLWWMRQARRSRKYVGHSDKKIKVYHTPTFRSARVAWMIAGKRLTNLTHNILRKPATQQLLLGRVGPLHLHTLH